MRRADRKQIIGHLRISDVHSSCGTPALADYRWWPTRPVATPVAPAARKPVAARTPRGLTPARAILGGMSSRDVVESHRRSGREFAAAGVTSFVCEEGGGGPVVCVHGVPSSSFLYRKVLAELAARGLRGVAWDLPGLGLAQRPTDFDYSWSGLGRFCVAAVDALGLQRFHLVVHDIGGPVGFELAAAMPGRVASLTVLNALVEVDTFKRPWSMEPFARRGLGELYLRTLTKPAFRALMRLQAIADMSAVTKDELDAYVDL